MQNIKMEQLIYRISKWSNYTEYQNGATIQNIKMEYNYTELDGLLKVRQTCSCVHYSVVLYNFSTFYIQVLQVFPSIPLLISSSAASSLVYSSWVYFG